MRRYLVFTPVDPIYEHHQTMSALKDHLARHLPDCEFVLAYQDTTKHIPHRQPDRFTAFPMTGEAQKGTGRKAGTVEVLANAEQQPDPDVIEALNIFDPRRPAPRLN